MYSFSTCWNSHRHTDGRAMLREIRDLGFENAELSHGTRISLVPGIMDSVTAGEMRISSLHNFCPLPMGVNHAAPNLYQCSSDSDSERESAERHTLKTLDFAARLKAPMVVLHSGSVDMKQYTDKLLGLVEKSGIESPKYQRLKADFESKLKSRKPSYWNRTMEALQRYGKRAGELGIRLGVENRQGVEELPQEADFAELFSQPETIALTYWHDTGHAQIKENLGLIKHLAHLQSLAARLSGFHIHDVQYPGKDHCPPGSGMIDFAALAPLVKKEHIKVFEFSPSMTAQDALKGIEHVKKLWGAE
jgi:sugar phosphate isomerase/epimerase